MPDEAGARRYYFRMRPVRAREGDRPLVPTLTADPGTPSASKEAAKAASAKTAPAPAQTAADGYTARHLSVLEGLEAVRQRPGMYIGSTDSRGLQHCLSEIIDNAVDEALAGHCKHITVVLHPDESLEGPDDGRGLPVGIEPQTGLTGLEGVMSKLHAGGAVRG